MKLEQRNLDQTGVAILKMQDGSRKEIPLYSVEPIKEAKELQACFFCEAEIEHVFFSNNLMKDKIETKINRYREGNNSVLPENYMDELLNGFPNIMGLEPDFGAYFYA